jgi:hypothetical protein
MSILNTCMTYLRKKERDILKSSVVEVGSCLQIAELQAYGITRIYAPDDDLWDCKE